jgi:SPP1 gp7 family putative phage head morphogenesis protein
LKELENASARFHISRLEALKIRTQNAAERAFGNELDALDDMAARIYMDDYYHTAYEIQKGLGIGFDVAQIDQRKLDNILSKPWTTDKQTFSDRIWKSKTQLLDSLHTELTQMCVLGKSPDQAIENISKRMNVSKGQAARLIRTEAAYFGSVAQKDCFNDLDVEKYEIVATLDSKTSDICRKMDGKGRSDTEPFFYMNEWEIGVTAPPFHCWCRSCTCPYFDDEFAVGERAARDENGKTYYVPANMKYTDWKEYFVDKTKDPADWLKKALEKTAKSSTIILEDILIGKSLGAKSKNYDVIDPASGEYFRFVEGTKIQNAKVFAGYGVKKPLHDGVAEGLTKEFGGDPEKWQHAKGIGVLDYYGDELEAEVHWFQEESVGKVKFKVKEWLE